MARNDDSSVIAAREHTSADPNCIPIVAELGPDAKRAWVSCQRERTREQTRQLAQLAGCPNGFGFAHFDRIALILSVETVS
jgi:hypothetical protein